MKIITTAKNNSDIQPMIYPNRPECEKYFPDHRSFVERRAAVYEEKKRKKAQRIADREAKAAAVLQRYEEQQRELRRVLAMIG